MNKNLKCNIIDVLGNCEIRAQRLKFLYKSSHRRLKLFAHLLQMAKSATKRKKPDWNNNNDENGGMDNFMSQLMENSPPKKRFKRIPSSKNILHKIQETPKHRSITRTQHKLLLERQISEDNILLIPTISQIQNNETFQVSADDTNKYDSNNNTTFKSANSSFNLEATQSSFSNITNAVRQESETPKKETQIIENIKTFKILTFDNLGTDDECDGDNIDNSSVIVPEWCKNENLNELLKVQGYVNHRVIDEFYAPEAAIVDLRKLFPGISDRLLIRSSSGIWNTPPRLPTKLTTK